jgi:hypothetical protein
MQYEIGIVTADTIKLRHEASVKCVCGAHLFSYQDEPSWDAPESTRHLFRATCGTCGESRQYDVIIYAPSLRSDIRRILSHQEREAT